MGSGKCVTKKISTVGTEESNLPRSSPSPTPGDNGSAMMSAELTKSIEKLAADMTANGLDSTRLDQVEESLRSFDARFEKIEKAMAKTLWLVMDLKEGDNAAES